MLILFTEIFTVTFINDCAVTTISTISLLRLRSVDLFNKRICVCVCVCVCVRVLEQKSRPKTRLVTCPRGLEQKDRPKTELVTCPRWREQKDRPVTGLVTCPRWLEHKDRLETGLMTCPRGLEHKDLTGDWTCDLSTLTWTQRLDRRLDLWLVHVDVNRQTDPWLGLWLVHVDLNRKTWPLPSMTCDCFRLNVCYLHWRDIHEMFRKGRGNWDPR